MENSSGLRDALRQPMAMGASVAALALLATGCGSSQPEQTTPASSTTPTTATVPPEAIPQSLDANLAVTLVKHTIIGASRFKDGMQIIRNPVPPNYTNLRLWGVVQYCDKKGGDFTEMEVDLVEVVGNTEPKLITRAQTYPLYKRVCLDGIVNQTEVPKATPKAPTNGTTTS